MRGYIDAVSYWMGKEGVKIHSLEHMIRECDCFPLEC